MNNRRRLLLLIPLRSAKLGYNEDKNIRYEPRDGEETRREGPIFLRPRS